MTKEIQKRVPADISLRYQTFLNDKKIDGELYGYLLSISIGKDGQTLVDKKEIKPWAQLAKDFSKIKPVTRQTLSAHFKILMAKGYIQEYDNNYYILPKVEQAYFMVPLRTLEFMTTVF